jgi:UDP-N-acetylmuramoylalanine--D-glutamate ligase
VEIRGKKIAVYGLGRTAVALVRLLLREGAHPFVTEFKSGVKFDAFRGELDALGVPYELGGHSEKAAQNIDIVIPSPGVSPEIAPIKQARAAGADLVSELELAWHFCGSRIMAVTGTNGKTTTTELLKTLVDTCGHSVLMAGNNDFPFSAAVMIEPAPRFIVLEISSYQLENVRRFRPWIASVLNVTPDHLVRHKTIENYAAAKARIFENQRKGDTSVMNADDAFVAAMKPGKGADVYQFSFEKRVAPGLYLSGGDIMEGEDEIAHADDTPLPGRHNLQNVLCALTMMRAGGFDWARTIEGLRAFRGVEHRIEYAGVADGVAFYNDSKSTNIDSLKVALESFEQPIVLIAGGEGKGSDYRVLRALVGARVRHLVTIGEDAAKLEAAFGDLLPVTAAADMMDAVEKAAAHAAAHSVVLLSPACASFDMYENFEHRGRVFKDCVREYLGQRRRL